MKIALLDQQTVCMLQMSGPAGDRSERKKLSGELERGSKPGPGLVGFWHAAAYVIVPPA